MANSITNITSSNTFFQWLTATQSAITILNKLTEGGACNDVFVANTNVEIANNLTVSGNLNLNVVTGNSLSISGNTTIGTALITYGNHEKANITLIVGSAGNFVNSSFNHANSGFIKSNSGFNHANSAYSAANNALNDSLAFAIALG
jgi:hypothetical protein